jgi:beta propeller repeat protein
LNPRLRIGGLVGAIFLLSLLPFAPGRSDPAPVAPSAEPAHSLDRGNLPLAFEANEGQTGSTVRFQAHTIAGMLFFTPAEVVLTLNAATPNAAEQESPPAVPALFGRLDPRPAAPATARAEGHTAAPSPPQVMRLQFLGANTTPTLRADMPLPGRVNYFLGNDPARWHTNVPTYGAVIYGGLYPGVDLRYDGTGRQLKGTYTLAPGADPTRIRWRYAGARSVQVDGDGNLQIATADSPAGQAPATLTEAAPVAWQEQAGRRVPVTARYQVAAEGTVGFTLGAYDATRPLILDPALVYSTYLGGSGLEEGYGIAVDGAGNVYSTGFTLSANFPTTNPQQAIFGGDWDAFVIKLDATGSPVYSTYLGGSGLEWGESIATDSTGNAYVAGYTDSDDFPTANALQATPGGGDDGFVSKLDPTGAVPVYSTYLGGSRNDFIRSIALDSAGNAYVTGYTESTDFPHATPLPPTTRGGVDSFVSKLGPTGADLLYSVYLGGTGNDYAWNIAVDGVGNAYIIGYTYSTDFPTVNPLQAGSHGQIDAFVSKLNSMGSALVYSTYLGGSGIDWGYGIAVDSSGSAYVTGYISSSDFPLVNPLQSTPGGAFVSKLDPAGSALVYSTYLGISDDGQSIAVDGVGNAYVTGGTAYGFPLANPLQPTFGGGDGDAFVSKLNPTGSALLYSTYVGGSGKDSAQAIAVNGVGNAYITGYTESTDFPVGSQPYQSIFGGYVDAMIAKIDGEVPVPPTLLPAALAPTPTDQQGPRVDGAVAVWEEFRDGTWDVFARNLATGQTFPVYQGPGDQRHPTLSGNLVVWQDNRNGTWDIYGARLLGNNTAGGPTPIAAGPGDEINPAASHNIVVWQSGALALATTTPESANRYDIAGAVITDTVGAPVVLTDGSLNTNTNPVVNVQVTPLSQSYFTTVLWQSHAPTAALQTPTGSPYWQVVGQDRAASFYSTPTPFAVPTRLADQTNPAVSGPVIVWQEYYTPTLQRPGIFEPGWDGVAIDRSNFGGVISVISGLPAPPLPAVSGYAITWQEFNAFSQTWAVRQTNLLTGTPSTITDGLSTAPHPDVSHERLVWQAPANPAVRSAGSVLNVYGNVATPTPISFSDVHPGDYFYVPVMYLASRGVISGYADGTFRPSNLTTRGQLAKIIVLGEGWAIDTSRGPHFSDVPPGAVFYDVIETAVNHGIISGYADGSFRPGNNVTRGQLCKIIVRAQNWAPDTTGGPHFSDVPPDAVFYDVIETAFHHGIISGYADGTFRPGNSATRGQIAKIVYGALTHP